VRITNQIIDRRALEAIQRSVSGLEESHSQVASGTRLRNAADDPAGYVGAMSADRRLAALVQYRRNVSAAEARLGAEEAVLDQVTNLIERGRELAISQAAANGTTQTRLIAKAEVDQLLAEAVKLGNSKQGNSWLFGGDFSDSAPFTPSGVVDPARPPVGGGSVEIGEGQTVSLNHDGQRVFVDSGVFAAFQQLSTALGTDDTPGVAASITSLVTSFDAVQDVLGETGARVRQLETASANIESLELTLRTQRSDLADIDIEEAISRLASRQTAYEAALLATARLNSLSLTDYLR
jgi:flagellar hook-associated protein 3 FlgL